jgi:hypothetical protein
MKRGWKVSLKGTARTGKLLDEKRMEKLLGTLTACSMKRGWKLNPTTQPFLKPVTVLLDEKRMETLFFFRLSSANYISAR